MYRWPAASWSGYACTPTFADETTTSALVVLFPAASRAVAVTECAPSAASAEFQNIANGRDVTGAPTAVPSTRNWTLATPTLSEASAMRLTFPDTAALDVGPFTATVGGVRSEPPPGLVMAVFMSV